jgi:hypothetical protein
MFGMTDLLIYFSDYFGIDRGELDNYGAFDVSLVNDLPLFVDPFLLFTSEDERYQRLHAEIIKYVQFLRDKSIGANLDDAVLKALFCFKEVRQNWLGFSKTGNAGSGLGMDFARALNRNLRTVFADFGQEKIAKGSHLEKLCLVREGVGRDRVSDLATTLIKRFLLTYTQEFAREYVKPEQRQVVNVPKVRFHYPTESWMAEKFELPFANGDFVLLTPKEILTKDDTWINKHDLYSRYEDIANALPDQELRGQINNYFRSVLPEKPTAEERTSSISSVFERFPILLDYYIRGQEERGREATALSDERVRDVEYVFQQNLQLLAQTLATRTEFYDTSANSLLAARRRVEFLKHVVEDLDGYRLFYVKGKPLKREHDLQVMFRLTWYATTFDVNREPNNGRGPVDFKISKGTRDKSLVEFKLASNSHLRRNLEKQVAIYEKANSTSKSLKVIMYFSAEELSTVRSLLRDLKLDSDDSIILIDARNDNKPSASVA